MEIEGKLRFNPEVKELSEKEPRNIEGVLLEFEKLAKRENAKDEFKEVRKFAENGVVYLWEVKIQGEEEDITFTYQKDGDYQGFENKETGKIEGRCASKGSVIIKECDSSYPKIVANYDGEKWIEV